MTAKNGNCGNNHLIEEKFEKLRAALCPEIDYEWECNEHIEWRRTAQLEVKRMKWTRAKYMGHTNSVKRNDSDVREPVFLKRSLKVSLNKTRRKRKDKQIVFLLDDPLPHNTFQNRYKFKRERQRNNQRNDVAIRKKPKIMPRNRKLTNKLINVSIKTNTKRRRRRSRRLQLEFSYLNS
eukprot:655548_1